VGRTRSLKGNGFIFDSGIEDAKAEAKVEVSEVIEEGNGMEEIHRLPKRPGKRWRAIIIMH
jgi:hypothetical protein